MQLKWMEDLVALGELGSFGDAAQARHVTHPAFGRRIKALEAWAGVPLVQRGKVPVRLTPAGKKLALQAKASVEAFAQTRAHLVDLLDEGRGQSVRLAAGRAMVRTQVADWLSQLRKPTAQPALRALRLNIVSRLMADAASMLADGQVDLLLSYHHPALSQQLDGRVYRHILVERDELVPVAQPGLPIPPEGPWPTLGYQPEQALGLLAADHLTNLPGAPSVQAVLVCDSVDALHEYALRGLGVAWLPLSLVARDLASKRLQVVGDAHLRIAFELRLYRKKQTLHANAELLWQFANDNSAS